MIDQRTTNEQGNLVVMPICPECRQPAERNGDDTEMTCMGELPCVCGRWLDPNRLQGVWVCANGHKFKATTGYACTCGRSSRYAREASKGELVGDYLPRLPVPPRLGVGPLPMVTVQVTTGK